MSEKYKRAFRVQLASNATNLLEEEISDGDSRVSRIHFYLSMHDGLEFSVPQWKRLLIACNRGEAKFPEEQNGYEEIRHYITDQLRTYDVNISETEIKIDLLQARLRSLLKSKLRGLSEEQYDKLTAEIVTVVKEVVK